MSHISRLEEKLALIKATSNPVFTKLYEESAYKQAKAADARSKPLSKLDGKIISIKDLFDVEGEVTWAGSKILKDSKPAKKTAPTIQSLIDAGAIIIGKTNMSEFAFHGMGTNSTFGNPLNAVNPLHVTGGSSSGAAASSALDMCDIAIGTDTGGSIRLPAAFNGIAGFKPSQNHVTRDGAFPLAHSLDSIGPLAKTLQACIDTDEVLSGVAFKPTQSQKLIYVATGKIVDEASDDVKFAFHASIERLGKAGFTLKEMNFDYYVDEILALLAVAPIVTIEAAAIHLDWLTARPQDYYPPVLHRIKMGAVVTGANYIRAMWKRASLINQFNLEIKDGVGILAPTALSTAPLISEVEASLEAFLAHNGKALRNCTIGNILDVCGVSLPCPDLKGMPVGLMLMGKSGDDNAVLNAGLALEKALK